MEEKVTQLRLLQDSVFKLVFKGQGDEKYGRQMRQLIYLENGYQRMSSVTFYLTSNKNLFNYNETKDFLEKNSEKYLVEHLLDDENLVLPDYSYFIGEGKGYLGYIIMLDRKRDTTIKPNVAYEFKEIDEAYTGKIKDHAFNQRINFELSSVATYEALAQLYALFEKYINKIKNPVYAGDLKSELILRREALVKSKIGNPASEFTLIDNKGINHSLSDFKGKVVYLDLWASWCAPCRQQTPYLKKIYEKYKSDNRIAIVSIAVNDKDKNWRRAILEDKPEWLQLIDNGTVNNSYVANEIPKFVIINKQGRIVTLNGPEPDSGEKLMAVLNTEMNK
ncbi:MAG: TlpA family protein disulfide reductase [Bacteroidota bacterium]|nr:TlpA family protein disulfide reductase [Bacteroidota bacterium]